MDGVRWLTGIVDFNEERKSRNFALKAGARSNPDKLFADVKRRVDLIADVAADVYLLHYGDGVPISLREKFKNSFKRQMAGIVSESTYGEEHELADKIARFNNTLLWYEERINAGNALIKTSDEGYPNFLFLSDGVDPTCERCEQNHDKILSAEKIIESEAIPPLHPNCHCTLVAIDNRTLDLYNRFSGLSSDTKLHFMSLEGGIFRLNLSDDGIEISATPIEIKGNVSDEINGITDNIFNAIVEFVDGLFFMRVNAEDIERESIRGDDGSIQSMIEENMPLYNKNDGFFEKIKKLLEGYIWGNVQRNYDEQMGEAYRGKHLLTA